MTGSWSPMRMNTSPLMMNRTTFQAARPSIRCREFSERVAILPA